ncbi:histidine phosphatase family protein [Candidatus Woesearchaeota archaeon]|nr:histidine phosphatase family protein [Candidatus Woesearchaeota archaeon]
MAKYHIYLFRHGQTYFNRDHRFTGCKDSKLTPKGVKDAKTVAQKLKNKKFQVAYQTHLSRSKDTLKYVLKYHPECKEIITDDRMLERCYGKLEGQTHDGFIERVGEKAYDALVEGDVIDDFSTEKREIVEKLIGKTEFDIIHRSYDVPPPEGESIKMVEKRVNSFIKDLLKKIKKDKVNVAISAHGNSMRPFRKYFEKLTRKQMMKLENPWDDYFHYVVEVK